MWYFVLLTGALPFRSSKLFLDAAMATGNSKLLVLCFSNKTLKMITFWYSIVISSVLVVGAGCWVSYFYNMPEQPRFHLLTPHELEELLFSRRAESSNRIIKSAEDVFREFCFVPKDYLCSILHTVMTPFSKTISISKTIIIISKTIIIISKITSARLSSSSSARWHQQEYHHHQQAHISKISYIARLVGNP